MSVSLSFPFVFLFLLPNITTPQPPTLERGMNPARLPPNRCCPNAGSQYTEI